MKKSNLIGDTVTSSEMILLFNYPKMIFLLSLELKSRLVGNRPIFVFSLIINIEL